jgi:transposase-like protein
MAARLSNEAWAQIRHDYEHTERPVADICAEHGISSGTLRDRMRRWDWTRRRPLIPPEGPFCAPAPPIELATRPLPTMQACASAAPSLAAAPGSETAAPCQPEAPQVAAGEAARACGEARDTAIVPRLQNTVDRVLLAIETAVAKLPPQATHPRELERAARALAALTRTLRELNGLLGQCQPPATNADDVDDDPPPEDIDEFRFELARRIHAFVDAHKDQHDDDSGPQL